MTADDQGPKDLQRDDGGKGHAPEKSKKGLDRELDKALDEFVSSIGPASCASADIGRTAAIQGQALRGGQSWARYPARERLRRSPPVPVATWNARSGREPVPAINSGIAYSWWFPVRSTRPTAARKRKSNVRGPALPAACALGSQSPYIQSLPLS